MRTLLLIAALGLSAPLSVPVWADTVRLQENAPDRHVVVKGDTLWDISEKFLKDPWLWPDVWQLNKDQIKNPHLIYPGDVVVLTMENGKPRLSLETGARQVVKLTPQVRGEPIVTQEAGIPAISPRHIASLLNHAGIISQPEIDQAPRLLGAVDDRMLVMRGDSVYASANSEEIKNWHIIRPGKELVDPETQEALGVEVQTVGRAQTVEPGNPQTLLVNQSIMEIAIGDKLRPYAPLDLQALTPHAPDKPVQGRVIMAYGGFAATSQYANVVINRGTRDGMEAGHVLAIHRQGRVIKDSPSATTWRYMDVQCVKPGKALTTDFYDPKEMLQECSELPPDAKREAWRYMDVGCLKPGAKIVANEFFDPKEVYRLHCRPDDEKEALRLPDHRVGLLFIYRVYDKVAYGLIMSADGPVYLMDLVKNP